MPPAKTLHLLSIFIVLSTLGTKAISAEILPPPPIANKGYHLVENWDFSNAITNKEKLHEEFFTRYIYNNGTLDKLGNEWERYRDNDNHVFGDGSLKLTARIVGGLKPGGIESGMLRSKWTGQYGYFECRMKVPRGRGMWPAFWLNPEDGHWPPEIDVVEVVNNGRDTTKNSFHILHNKFEPPVDITTKLNEWKSYRPGFDYAEDFHTFAVEWTPDTVTHYVDNEPIATRKFHWTHTDGSKGGPAHVLVNLGVGGDWPGAPQSTADFPAELAVKYIRVWQKN
ncbi:hypothetical protein BH09VER1_BH09VER1_16250 [soil metagenome]